MRENAILIASGIAMALVMAALVEGGIEQERQWEHFKQSHHCRVVAHIDGDTLPAIGVSSSGNPTMSIVSTPDKTGWLCDDGVTYYR